MFVSGAEPSFFNGLGIRSNLPEEYGADFFWESMMGKVGVQRKAFPGDFLASMQDGRLNRELLQMQALDVRVLVIEGEQRARWSNSGHLMQDYSERQYTKDQHRNFLAEIGLMRGVVIQHTNDMSDTAAFIESFKTWTNKEGGHHALDKRPAAQKKNERLSGFWDTISNRDFQRYFLMSFYFIGPKRAEAMLDHYHGLPFKLDTTLEELVEIPGWGPTTAQRFWDVFHSYQPPEDVDPAIESALEEERHNRGGWDG